MSDAVNEKLNEIYASMSIEELVAAQASLGKLIEVRRVENRSKAIAAAREAAKALGFSVEELFGGEAAKKAAGKVAQKYANPTNPSQTWSGRGKRPKWVSAALEAGLTKDDLLAKS
jgi:DNA-binding protein H-NS